jgi:hypothetical protein
MAAIDDKIQQVQQEVVKQQKIYSSAQADIASNNIQIHTQQNNITSWSQEIMGASRHKAAISAANGWISTFAQRNTTDAANMQSATTALNLLIGTDGKSGTLAALMAQKQTEINAQNQIIGLAGKAAAAQQLAASNLAASNAADTLATIQGAASNKKYWIIGGILLACIVALVFVKGKKANG